MGIPMVDGQECWATPEGLKGDAMSLCTYASKPVLNNHIRDQFLIKITYQFQELCTFTAL